MRIVAGKWRGRLITAPKGNSVRPTGDRVRESWMNIIQSLLPGARVGDFFAGSGALGLEALSRGAASAEFIENAATSLDALSHNINKLGAGAEATVRRADAIIVATERADDPYDLAFAVPPYRTGLAVRIATCWLRAPFARVLGIEHDPKEVMPGAPETRQYGSTALSFYRMTTERTPSDRLTEPR